jgi:WD40 repeat protein
MCLVCCTGCPFHAVSQIKAFVSNCLVRRGRASAAGAASGVVNGTSADGAATADAADEFYRAVLDLGDLGRTPLSLQLLASIWEDGGRPSDLGPCPTRYDLYCTFTKHWHEREFTRREREFAKIQKSYLAVLRVPDLRLEEVTSFADMTSGVLAWLLRREGKTGTAISDVPFDEVDLQVQAPFVSTLTLPSVSSPKKRKAVDNLASALPDIGVFREVGGERQFYHSLFGSFFFGRLILATAGSDSTPLLDRCRWVSNVLSLGSGRTVRDDPEMLLFLSEYWNATRTGDPTLLRVKECLHALVRPPADGLAFGDQDVAGNAVTILNFVGEPMCGFELKGITLSGADLSRAVLCRANLQDSVLQNCRFDHANLRGADLTNAELPGSRFGFRAPLHVDQPVTSVVCDVSAPDRVYIVADGVLQCWYIPESTGEALQDMTVLDPVQVVGTCLSTDAVWLAFVTLDGRFSLLELAGGIKQHDMFSIDSRDAVTAVAVAVNGDVTYAAWGSHHGALWVWTRSTGASGVVGSWQLANCSIQAITFVCSASDIVVLLGLASGELYQLDLSPTSSPSCMDSLSGSVAVTCMASSVNRKSIDIHAAVGFGDGSIHLCTSTSDGLGLADTVLVGHRGAVCCLQFGTLDDGACVLASGGADCSVRVWDLHTCLLHFEVMRGHTAPVTSISFGRYTCDSGQHVMIVSGGMDKHVRFWSGERARSEPVLGHSDAITCVSALPMDPERAVLLTTGDDMCGHAVHIDANPAGTVNGGAHAFSPRFSAVPRASAGVSCMWAACLTGSVRVVAGCFDGRLLSYTVDEGQYIDPPVVFTSKHEDEVTSISPGYGSKGELAYFASCSLDGHVILWSADGELVYSVKVGRPKLRSILYSWKPLSFYVFVENGVAWCLTLDVPSETLETQNKFSLRDPKDQAWQVTAMTAGSIGAVQVVLFAKRPIEILGFNVVTEQLEFELQHDPTDESSMRRRVTCLAMSHLAPNGKNLIASGDEVGTVLVWAVGNGDGDSHLIICQECHKHSVTGICFLQGSAHAAERIQLCTGGRDNLVRLWEVRMDGDSPQLVMLWTSRSETQTLDAVSLSLTPPSHPSLPRSQLALLANAGSIDAARALKHSPSTLVRTLH